MFNIKNEMVDFLHKIKQNYEIIMLSNISKIHKNHLLEIYPQVKVFNSYVFSCDVGERKPDKKIYEIALSKTKSKPEECIFIDDLKENIEGSKKIGINSIQFTTLNNLTPELKKFNINI